MIIHTTYKGFLIRYSESECQYRVHDQPGNPGLADTYLHLPNMKTAQAYIDTLIECICNPLPEPKQSERLEPFYRSTFRDDGPIPTILGIYLQPPQGCQHVLYLPARGGWTFCNKEPKRGSTRCWDHERIPQSVEQPTTYQYPAGFFEERRRRR